MSEVEGCPTKRTMKPHKQLEIPWDKVEIDLFTLGRLYQLIMMHYHIRFPDVAMLEDTTATTIGKHIKSIFA